MPFKAAGTGKNMFDSEYFLKTPRKRDCISKEKEVQKQEGSSGGEKGLKGNGKDGVDFGKSD